MAKQNILRKIEAGDQRALSKLISLVENRDPQARRLQKELFKGHSRKGQVIGITGAPGAGKSTLADLLAVSFRERGKNVAVIAVDPSSPFSGGAILGDRIRMVNAMEKGEIFVRSMATRGSLGGLAAATLEVVEILRAVNFDVVLVETVGVGQGEVDIARLADSCVVVLVPGMGDSVQAFKAGLLEIADVFVINKADREGADVLMKDLHMLISLGSYASDSWRPPVRKTVAIRNEGVGELVLDLNEHAAWLSGSEAGLQRRIALMEQSLLRLLAEEVSHRTLANHKTRLTELAQKCLQGKSDFPSALQELLALV